MVLILSIDCLKFIQKFVLSLIGLALTLRVFFTTAECKSYDLLQLLSNMAAILVNILLNFEFYYCTYTISSQVNLNKMYIVIKKDLNYIVHI